MRLRASLAVLLSLLLIGCGVKNDLEIPSGRTPPADEHDPSRPPAPLGQ